MKIGTRVRVIGTGAGVILASDTGVVDRKDQFWDEFYIVRLDDMAIYRSADGQEELLPEVRVSLDNLWVLDDQVG